MKQLFVLETPLVAVSACAPQRPPPTTAAPPSSAAASPSATATFGSREIFLKIDADQPIVVATGLSFA